MRGLWLLPTCALLLLAWPCFYFWGFSLPSLLLFRLSCINPLSHSKRTNRRNRQRAIKWCEWQLGCVLQIHLGAGNREEKGRAGCCPMAPGSRGSPRLLPTPLLPTVTRCSPADLFIHQIQFNVYPVGWHRRHLASLEDTGTFISTTNIWALSSSCECK